MAAAAAAGHAGLCHGVCLHRFFAVQRPAASGPARNLWPRRPPAARGAQPVGRNLGVYLFALPVCVFAGARRVGRARRAFDGSRAAAGRAARPAHQHYCAAAGAPSSRCGRSTGADGDAGRLWCHQLLWYPDLHHRHFESVAGYGQPLCRRAVGDDAAGAGFIAAMAGAPRRAPFALHG